MPEIPLFNGGQSVKTGQIPGMPMDQERRPRADFRGIIAGLGDVARGQETLVKTAATPLLDPGMFDGLEKGREALAKGISDVGEILQSYEKKRRETVDDRDEGNAAEVMTKAAAETVVTRDPNRPETWAKGANEALTKKAAELVANPNLSPTGREKVGQIVEGIRLRTVGELTITGDEALWETVRGRHLAGLDEAQERGDYTAVEEGAAKALAKQYIEVPEAVARLNRTKARSHELLRLKDLEMDPVQSLTWMADPGAEGVPEHFARMTPVQKGLLEPRAQTMLLQKQQVALRQVKADLKAGTLGSAEEALMGPGLTRLFGEGEVARLTAALVPDTGRAGEQAGAFLRQYVAVREHDGGLLTGDAELEAQRLRTMNELFPDAKTAALNARLDEALAGLMPGGAAVSHGLRQILGLQEQGWLDLDGDGVPDAPEQKGGASMAREVEGRLDGKTGTLSLPPPGEGNGAGGVIKGASAGRGAGGAERAYGLMRGLEQHAAGLGRSMTTMEVEKWIDEMTVVEQRYAGAKAVKGTAEQLRIPLRFSP